MPIDFFQHNCTVAIQVSEYSIGPLDRAATSTVTTQSFRAFLKTISGTSSNPKNRKEYGIGLPEAGFVGHTAAKGDTDAIEIGQDLFVTFDDGSTYKGKFRRIQKDPALYDLVTEVLNGDPSDQLIVDTSEQD